MELTFSARMFQQLHILPLPLTLGSTLYVNVYENNALFRTETWNVFPLNATREHLGMPWIDRLQIQ